MLNLNKHTKLKPKPTLQFKNCSYVCAYHCAQLSYTTQYRTVLIIFPSYPPDNHNGSDDVYWSQGSQVHYTYQLLFPLLSEHLASLTGLHGVQHINEVTLR